MALKRTIKPTFEATAPTFAQAFDEFMAEKEAHNLSKATLKNYQQSYDYFIAFHNFNPDEDTVDEVTQSHFYKWINSLKLDGNKPTSINHYLRDCRTFFYWCMDVDRKYITNPFKISQIEGQEEQLKLFPDDELELLLEKPERSNNKFTDWRTWAVVNWVLGTGNRASTIVDVQIGDIDFRKKEIALRHTKNKKAQIIPLSSSLETVLKEYCRIWRKNAPAEAYLFCNVGEAQLTTNALQNSFAKYCKARGATHTNIHGLRHNFAKGWVKNNGNMYVLQKLLGHSTLDMTRKYVNLFSEDIKEDFDRFNPLDTIKRKQKRTQTIKRNDY